MISPGQFSKCKQRRQSQQLPALFCYPFRKIWKIIDSDYNSMSERMAQRILVDLARLLRKHSSLLGRITSRAISL